MGDEVDGFGAAFGKDYFLRILCIEEVLHDMPRAFIVPRRFLREQVHAAVCIGVCRAQERVHGLEDALRLLRRCGAVEVGEGMDADAASEDGELTPDFVKRKRHIETIGLG